MLSKSIKYLATFFFLLAASSASAAEPSGDLTLLVAKDKTRVYASHYRAFNNNSKIALLFHQAGSNRMEYETVLSLLHVAGFDTLTVDQRSGGTRWDTDNMTVKRIGESAEYAEAYPDMEAALDYAIKRKYKKIMLVGSSYSASLAIVLASKNPDKIIAVAAFSPGEYFPNKNRIKTAASRLNVPLYITGAREEMKRVEEVVINADDQNITFYRPLNSVHGISSLRKDQNPDGYKANMENFSNFVERFK